MNDMKSQTIHTKYAFSSETELRIKIIKNRNVIFSTEILHIFVVIYIARTPVNAMNSIVKSHDISMNFGKSIPKPISYYA